MREDITELLSKCIQCGLCRDTCPSYAHGGCDPMSVMNGDTATAVSCIGCERCSYVCEQTDPFRAISYIKCMETNAKVPKVFAEEGFVMHAAKSPSLTELSFPWKGDDAYVMPGCMVRCRAPYLMHAAAVALDSIGMKCSELPGNTCCTFPAMLRSLTDGERNSYKKKMNDSASGKQIMTLCPGCESEMSGYGSDAIHIAKVLAKNAASLPKLKMHLRVALEPGCHEPSMLGDMKRIADAVGAEYIGNDHGCCGKSVPRISSELMDERQKEIAGADAVIVACPSCFLRYDSVKDGNVPVMHIVELVALAAGDGATLKYHIIHSKVSE